MADVSIITVGTNEKNDVLKCLASIQKSRTRFSLETILVDNASKDGTFEAVRAQFPSVHIIRRDKIKGYIENNQLAQQQAKGRYILLLNSDIELKTGTLEHMLNFMEAHPDAAASACKLLFEDGSLQMTCRRFPTPLTYLARLPHFFRWIKGLKPLATNSVTRRYLMMDYDHVSTRKVDWLVSAFFLLRRKAIEHVGPVGEGLVQPFYLEDVDWCFRARVKGWSIYYVPEAEAFHYYKRGSVKKLGRLSFVHMANIAIFFAKNGWAMMLGKHRK